MAVFSFGYHDRRKSSRGSHSNKYALKERKTKTPLKQHFKGVGHAFAYLMVGMTGFEPAASSSRTKRATGLRYIPKMRRGRNIK